MSKGDSETLYGHAQPLLRGINLARYLCDRCPFIELDADATATNGSSSALPPSAYEGVFDDDVCKPSSEVPPDSNTGVHHEPSNRGASCLEGSD